MVIALVEVSGHFVFLWFMGDLVEVRLKPLFDTVFCLAYILFPARATRDAIHNVIAVASGLCSGMVLSVGHLRSDFTGGIEFGTVSTRVCDTGQVWALVLWTGFVSRYLEF